MSLEYVGPMDHTYVVLDGRQVPFLQAAFHKNTAQVALTLDHRFSLDVGLDEAESVVRFVADALAIGMGYASFPREGHEPVPSPAFPRMTGLSGFEEGHDHA